MNLWNAALLGLCLTAGPGAETTLTVQVGGTASLPVGYSRGLRCDDVSIVQAELNGGDPKNNVLWVKGLKPGITYCRAGLEPGMPWVVVKVQVGPAQADKPAAESPEPKRTP